MKLADKAGPTALGFAIASFIALIFCFVSSTDISTVLFFFVLSIICTVGLTLIVYLPIFYLIGTAAQAIFDRPNEPKIPNEKSTDSLTHVQKAARSYITKARNQGYSDERIVALMRKSGWSEGSIRFFFPEL
jgi:hypothetical protein